MANEILTARKGPVLEITLNRPEIGNAASDAMAVELARLLLGAAESSEIVVLRGAGNDFCVGRESMGRRAPPAHAGVGVGARARNCFLGRPGGHGQPRARRAARGVRAAPPQRRGVQLL